MAHFTELKVMTDPTGFTSDSHQVVQRVIVVGNENVPSDMHVDGETWCINFFKGGIWKQTSYNNNFRKKYAGMGDVYDPVKDKFVGAQPFASWTLDSNDDWQAPIAYPTVLDDGENGFVWWYYIRWDDSKYQADNTKGWEATKSNDTSDSKTIYDWNGLSWVSE